MRAKRYVTFSVTRYSGSVRVSLRVSEKRYNDDLRMLAYSQFKVSLEFSNYRYSTNNNWNGWYIPFNGMEIRCSPMSYKTAALDANVVYNIIKNNIWGETDPRTFLKLLTDKNLVEVVFDPRIGEYVRRSDLVDTSLNRYLPCFNSDKFSKNDFAVLARDEEDARKKIMGLLITSTIDCTPAVQAWIDQQLNVIMSNYTYAEDGWYHTIDDIMAECSNPEPEPEPEQEQTNG